MNEKEEKNKEESEIIGNKAKQIRHKAGALTKQIIIAQIVYSFRLRMKENKNQ